MGKIYTVILTGVCFIYTLGVLLMIIHGDPTSIVSLLIMGILDYHCYERLKAWIGENEED